MGYASEHSGAHADVTAAGFALSFTRTSSTYDPTTDTESAPSSTSYPGVAMRLEGDPRVYESLSLTQREPVTLFFVPDTYGASLPPLGATLAFNGATYTVRSVSPFDPDGAGAIYATVIVSR